MPNYIVNTAQFNPIDFATRIKPMEEYAKNFNAQQDAIDAISLEGDSISSLITNNDEDKGLRDLYSSFDNSVGEAVSNMLSTGDISAGRRAIANLSRFYKKNLEPIKTAAAARSKAISDYEAIKQKDRSYLGTNPNQFGVSSYLNGATPSIYGVSGKDLYAMANADAVAASSRESNIEDYKLSKGLLEQYFVRGKEQGFNNQQIGNLLLGDVLNYKALSEKEKNSLPIERRKAMDYISSAYDRVASAYDINSLNTVDADGNIGITNDYTQAGTFILNGLYSGMTYKYDEDHLDNQGYLNPLQQAQLNKPNREAAAAENADLGGAPMPYVNIPFVDASGAIDTSKYQEDMEFLAKMLDNPALLNEEREEPPITVVTPQNEFHPVIDEGRKVKYNMDRLQSISRKYGLSFTPDEKDEVYNLERAEAAISKLANDVAKNAKLYQATQYRTTDDSNVVDVVNNASKVAGGIVDASGRKSKEVSSIPKGGTFILNPTLTGNQNYIEYKVEDKDGNVKTYKVSPENFSNRMRGYIEAYKQAVAAGDTQNVAAWRHQIMTEIYTTANGRAKTQTDTDSKLGAEE